MCPGGAHSPVRRLRGLRGRHRTVLSGCGPLWGNPPSPVKQAQPSLTPGDSDVALHLDFFLCWPARGVWHPVPVTTQSAGQNNRAQEGLACADVGITPGSDAFGRCVTDLLTLCGPNKIWRKTDCGLVSSLRVSDPQIVRDLSAATVICISRAVREHIRDDELPYGGTVHCRQAVSRPPIAVENQGANG